MAASSSTENKSTVPLKETAMQYYLYPPPMARYEDVIASPKLFMDTLGNFHAAMGTKFMIPIVGGKDLDLHRLFVEVTSRGGIKRVLEEKKWKEVTNSFSFPPSATNASFILRKYYMSLIHHFEQVYYFKAKAWTPVSTDTWQSTKSTLTSTSGMYKAVLPLPQMASTKQQRSPYEEIQVTSVKRPRTSTEDSLPKATSESSIGFPVTGIIDGKFDSGYLCTVIIGGEQLQGVLYQSIGNPSYQIPRNQGVVPQRQITNVTTSETATPASTVVRRRRRKKSEMKKRDPAHPKPNRSGYNFFFAEQHARLKPLHPGKDRDISRMIGELWNNLTEPEKAVYQEKAMRDKERYRIEMEHYRESLRVGQLMNNVSPVQQQPCKPDVNMVELDENNETDGGGSPRTPENELSSGCSDKSSYEGEEKTADRDSDTGIPLAVEIGAEVVDMETVAGREDHLLLKGLAKIGRGGEESLGDVDMEATKELLVLREESIRVDNEKSSMFVDESIQQKSVSDQEVEPVIIQKESVHVQANESKSDGKNPGDESIMDENETKSADYQEKEFVGIQEKNSVACDGRAENGHFPVYQEETLTGEQRDVENPVPVQEKEIVFNGDGVGNGLPVEEKQSAASEEMVENRPVSLQFEEPMDIEQKLEKDPDIFQEKVSMFREDQAENESVHAQTKPSFSSEERFGKESMPAKEGESLTSEARELVANN